MSLLSIVASSSAFRLPASPPPKGSSIDSDWSTKNKKQPGFLRLISAWYAMVFLHLSWHHENYDSHVPEVTGWSPVATIPRTQQRPVGGSADRAWFLAGSLRRAPGSRRPVRMGRYASGGREFLVCLLCIGSTLQDCQERLSLSHKQHHLLLVARRGCRPHPLANPVPALSHHHHVRGRARRRRALRIRSYRLVSTLSVPARARRRWC